MGSISEILFTQDPCYMETIQFICFATQLSRNRQYFKSVD